MDDATQGFTVFHFLIIAMIVAYIFWPKKKDMPEIIDAKGPRLHCIDCGSSFQPGHGPARGNGWIEIVLYFFMILPGVMYSIWRRSGSGKRECTVCGSSRAVPFTSPAAVAHRKTLGID